jgi:hypothetical protein
MPGTGELPAPPNGLQIRIFDKETAMIGSLMMCVSVVILLIGMLAGIAMGMTQNFVLAPAHAHLNLVGGVLLFLFGLYYRLVPGAGTTTLALPSC